MGASLADQPGVAAAGRPPCLAIALGANLPSPIGPPLATLLALRPLLEALLLQELPMEEPLEPGTESPQAELLRAESLRDGRRQGRPRLRWSPLFRTAPVGGPSGQPAYLNAVLLVEACPLPADPAAARTAALGLLERLQGLEQRFGRRRLEHWGPRSLDLDLLWWGALHGREPALELPHPRWQERTFVLAPLAALDPALQPPGAPAPVAALLASQLALLAAGEAGHAPPPRRLPPRPGWPE